MTRKTMNKRDSHKHHKKTHRHRRGGGMFDTLLGVGRIRGQRYEKWLEQRLVSVFNDTEFVNTVRKKFGYDKTNIVGRGQLTKQMVDDELCKRSVEDRNLIAPNLNCNNQSTIKNGGKRHKKTRRRHHKQRGGYHQYMGDVPDTPSYSTGGPLAPADSALANPVPYDKLSNLTNCVDNYNHYTNKGFQVWN